MAVGHLMDDRKNAPASHVRRHHVLLLSDCNETDDLDSTNSRTATTLAGCSTCALITEPPPQNERSESRLRAPLSRCVRDGVGPR